MENEIYKCEWCGAEFKSKQGLDSHNYYKCVYNPLKRACQGCGHFKADEALQRRCIYGLSPKSDCPKFIHASGDRLNIPYPEQTMLMKWGFVNLKREFVIKPIYDWACEFSEGYAHVRVGAEWGFIDKSGNWLIEPCFSNLCGFSESFAAYEDKSGLWGYIKLRDGALHKEIDPRFKVAGEFKNGLAPVLMPDGNEWEGKWGFVDTGGRLAILPLFADVGSFSNKGRAMAKISGRWFWINRNGIVTGEQRGLPKGGERTCRWTFVSRLLSRQSCIQAT